MLGFLWRLIWTRWYKQVRKATALDEDIISPRISFSFIHQEPNLTGVSSLASPFVDLTYSPATPYYQKSSQNTLQTPLDNNKNPTKLVFTVIQLPSCPSWTSLPCEHSRLHSNCAHDIKLGKRLTRSITPSNHVQQSCTSGTSGTVHQTFENQPRPLLPFL